MEEKDSAAGRECGLEERIDLFRFARDGGGLNVRVPITALTRCSGLVGADTEYLSVELNGFVKEGKSFLRLRAEGVLRFICQRCLSDLNLELAVDEVALLVRPTQVATAAGIASNAFSIDEIENEIVVAGEAVRVVELVEDEVLLALPISPTHSACSLDFGGAVSS